MRYQKIYDLVQKIYDLSLKRAKMVDRKKTVSLCKTSIGSYLESS